MKKPYYDNKRKPHHANYNVQETFSIEKLEKQSPEVIEMFKLLQAVRLDRTRLQDVYNSFRLKFSNDRMCLESTLIKIKKDYNARISSLHEQYNSVKSNSTIELDKIRKN